MREKERERRRERKSGKVGGMNRLRMEEWQGDRRQSEREREGERG